VIELGEEPDVPSPPRPVVAIGVESLWMAPSFDPVVAVAASWSLPPGVEFMPSLWPGPPVFEPLPPSEPPRPSEPPPPEP
jgi:hypothetical protein